MRRVKAVNLQRVLITRRKLRARNKHRPLKMAVLLRISAVRLLGSEKEHLAKNLKMRVTLLRTFTMIFITSTRIIPLKTSKMSLGLRGSGRI